MKIVAMLRVRNEARWLAEVLASVLTVTPHIVVFDDHSTDETRDIARAAGAAVIPSPFSTLDETRDKNYILERVRLIGADYVLCIDGDEVLDSNAAAQIHKSLNPAYSVYSFRVVYLWGDREHFRADGVYGRFHRASMFSLIDQPATAAYMATPYGKNFHCGNIPQGLAGSGRNVDVKILHLGYMLKEDRLRKYAWYNEQDPNNSYEDRYRHMVIGDVFPAESEFLHGGPLKVWKLTDGVFPSGAVR